MTWAERWLIKEAGKLQAGIGLRDLLLGVGAALSPFLIHSAIKKTKERAEPKPQPTPLPVQMAVRR